MADSDVPRIGIIGGGTYGQMHLKAFSQMQADGTAALVALAEVDEPTRGRREQEFGVKTYATHREMLDAEQLDGVTVVTPDHLHRDVVLDALAAGCHVLVEKPMDVTVEGGRAMIEAARRGGRLLMVDFHKRYDPYHRDAAERVAAGQIGRVLYGSAHMEDRIEVPRDWPLRKWVARSSPAWFIGVHMLDLLLWICRGTPVAVSATGVKDKLAGLGIDTYDSVSVRVDLESGATLSVDLSWVLPQGFEAIVNQGIRIVGTEGVIEIDSQDHGARYCTAAEGQSTPNLSFYRQRRDRAGNLRFEGYGVESICHFAELVGQLKDGTPLEALAGTYADGNEGLTVTKIGVAAHRSAAEGGTRIQLASL
jgi:predicted dehydrogenase